MTETSTARSRLSVGAAASAAGLFLFSSKIVFHTLFLFRIISIFPICRRNRRKKGRSGTVCQKLPPAETGDTVAELYTRNQTKRKRENDRQIFSFCRSVSPARPVLSARDTVSDFSAPPAGTGHRYHITTGACADTRQRQCRQRCRQLSEVLPRLKFREHPAA